MRRRHFLSLSILVPVASALSACAAAAEPAKGVPVQREVVKTAAEWKKLLSAEQYTVLFEKGTERAFSGKYWNEHRVGIYNCMACKLPLYSSADKFESGTGWPSFTRPVAEKAVEVIVDKSYGMVREEVVCRRCGGHQGHVFDDGPAPTGKRYCINSASIDFVPKVP